MQSDIVVIGGGLIGLTTAWELLERGHTVTIVEGNETIAAEASFANGGLITPSMPEPWNGPGVGKHLLSSLFDPRSAMKLRLAAIPSLVPWGLHFLRNSAPNRYHQAIAANFDLCSYSAEETIALVRRLNLNCDFAASGTLKVFRTQLALDAATDTAQYLVGRGLKMNRLTVAETIQQEPLLAPVRQDLAGAILYPEDCAGDARKFCLDLAHRFTIGGGTIKTGFKVTDFRDVGRNCFELMSDSERVSASQIVLAAGASAPFLARQLGFRLRVAPAKGYSVTLNGNASSPALRRPVIDDALHTGFTPLGTRLRLVGTAEFAGFDRTIRDDRITNLISIFRALFPELAGQVGLDQGTPWAGLRPMSDDGVPIVGKGPSRGIWVNCGHGHLGWTMAVGSAKLLADQLEAREPALLAQHFALCR